MSTIRDIYQKAIDRGVLSKKHTVEEFEKILRNENLRRKYWEYADKNFSGFYSNDYNTFSKNTDNLLAISNTEDTNPSVSAYPAPTTAQEDSINLAKQNEGEQQYNVVTPVVSSPTQTMDYNAMTLDELQQVRNEQLRKAQANKERRIGEQKLWEQEHPFLASVAAMRGGGAYTDKSVGETLKEVDADQFAEDSKEQNAVKEALGRKLYESNYNNIGGEVERMQSVVANISREDKKLGERKDLDKAEYVLDQAHKLATAPSKYDPSTNGFVNFGKGIADNTNRDLIPAVELIRDVNINNAIKKMNDGKELTKGERALILSYITYSDVQQARQYDLPMGYQAGAAAAESIPFMAEMLLTKGASKLAVSQVIRIMKAAGKTADQINDFAKWMNLGAKGIKVDDVVYGAVEEGAKNTLGDIARNTVSELVGTTLQTAAMPSTYQGMVEDNMRTRLATGENDIEGYNMNNLRNFGNAWVQTLTERKGGELIDWGLGKIMPFDKIWHTKAGNQMVANQFFQSPVAETMEEYLAAVINYGRSFNPLYSEESNAQLKQEAEDMFTAEGLGKTFLSMLPNTILGGAVNLYDVHKTSNDYNNARAKVLGELVKSGATQEQAENILMQIETSNEEEMREKFGILYSHFNIENAGGAGAKAAEEYIKAAQAYQFSVADLANKFANLTPEEQAQAQQEMQDFTSQVRQKAVEHEARMFAQTQAGEATNEDGNIYQVTRADGTTPEGSRMYISAGNVVTTDDGKGQQIIDRTQSSKDVFVTTYDADGNANVEHVALDELDLLFAPTSRQQVEDELYSMFMQEYAMAQQMAAQQAAQQATQAQGQQVVGEDNGQQPLGATEGEQASNIEGRQFTNGQQTITASNPDSNGNVTLSAPVTLSNGVVTDQVMPQQVFDDLISGLIREEGWQEVTPQPTAQGQTQGQQQAPIVWSEMDANQATATIVERSKGDKERAKKFAQKQVEVKTKALQEAQAEMDAFEGDDLDAFNAAQDKVDAAQAEVDKWTAVANGIDAYVAPIQPSGNISATSASGNGVVTEGTTRQSTSNPQQSANNSQNTLQNGNNSVPLQEKKRKRAQEIIDKIQGGNNTVYLFDMNDIIKVLEDAGVSQISIGNVKKQIAQMREGDVIGGFQIGNKIFINYDQDENEIRRKYVHERQHILTTAQLANKIASSMSWNELFDVVCNLCGSRAYQDRDAIDLANELISFSMEWVYEYDNNQIVRGVLKKNGLNEEQILTLINLGNEQRKDNTLSRARRTAYVNNSRQESRRQDGRDISEITTRNMEGQGVRPSITSESGTPSARGEVTQDTALEESGIQVNDETGDARFSVNYRLDVNQMDILAEQIAERVGVSKTKAKKWLKAETSLAALCMQEDNVAALYYFADGRYGAIKNNSDYPQGTVDFNNICRKRLDFTNIYLSLQREFPNKVFTAKDLETIRQIMIEDGLEVACGLCYVEDRRQLLGEIANEFRGFLKDRVIPEDLSATKKEVMQKVLDMVGDDTYIPTIAQLLEAGAYELRNSHPSIFEAFVVFNNSRGMQSGRLFEGYAEYKREILDWSDKKVKQVNDAGGLRIFSFSDFEAHHLIDIVQIISDAASKGVMIQGYTKVPEFARAIRNTKVKLNRSLIPLGDTGIQEENGEKVLAYDTTEGIDVNNENFLDESNNPNVGNVLVGINDEQIRMAMDDTNVDYIIPFHTGLKKDILLQKKIGAWVNYKNSQTEKDATTGSSKTADGKKVVGVNIYTDVLQAAEKEGTPIKNRKEFVEYFLKVCKERGLVPRFEQFLARGKNGEYKYTKGYEKLLVDFKMFDKRGNILPQEPVVPIFDDAFNQQIIEDYVKGTKETKEYESTKEKIKENLQLNESTDDLAVSESQVRYSIVTDKKKIEELEASEKMKGYRTVILNEDGTFSSPMATGLGNKGKTSAKTSGFELGKWEQAEERPELADENGKINLKPKEGGDTYVDYNPYIHNRLDKINTQFTSAWRKPFLVYIETEIPMSDIESGYHAEKAALSVGVHSWNGGDLVLSRYDKPVRIVPWDEVADAWAEQFDEVTFDIVNPELLPLLHERGVKILPPKKAAKEKALAAYKKWKAENSKPRFSITAEEDKAYADAVARGDMETAQDMLRDAAERAGYAPLGDYKDSHQAPSATVEKEYFTNIDALQEQLENGNVDSNLFAIAQGVSAAPQDYFSPQGARWYGYGNLSGMESYVALASAMRSIQAQMREYGEVREMPKVKVYRAVPKNIKGAQLESEGQWVSPSREYAVGHGRHRFGFNQYRIVEQEVPADQLWWDANDIREWGFDDGTVNAYQNTKNNRKLYEVTYDDNGELIPLSKRFDKRKADVRFSVTAQEDAAYMDAVNRGDMETAQRMVNEAAKNAMPDTKVVDERGNPLVVYHGTNAEFTIFDDRYRGISSGDNGFFGRGFYFTFGNKELSKAEAGYYGGRIMEAFVDVHNPFMFLETIYKTYNEKNGDANSYGGNVDESLAIINYVRNFPELLDGIEVNKVVLDEDYNGTYENVTLEGYVKEFEDVYNNKTFNVEEIGNGLIRVTADPKEMTSDGFTWTDYGFSIDMVKPVKKADAQFVFTHYYMTDRDSNRSQYYSLPDRYVIHRIAESEEFTNLLKERGYDGVMQSAKGDEVVAFYPNQIKSADPVTYDDNGNVIPLSERFNNDKNDIRFSLSNTNQRIFVSNAERAVESIKQEKATPQQWKAMIEKQGGLKAGEDKWLGLSEWLDSKVAPAQENETMGEMARRVAKNTITKQEILDYIAEHQIQIEEVEYAEEPYTNSQKLEDYRYEFELKMESVEFTMEPDEAAQFAFDQMVEEYGDDFAMAFEYDENYRLQAIEDVFGDEDTESAAAYFLNEGVKPINDVRLQYTTKGLENKREIALTVPTVESWNEGDKVHFGDAGEGRAIAWVRFGETEAQTPREVIDHVDELQFAYTNANGQDVYAPQGSKFSKDYAVYGKLANGEMGYVLYVRNNQLSAHPTLEAALEALNAHYEANPRQVTYYDKVLVIDEIQSKRHQDGREKGYATKKGRDIKRKIAELTDKQDAIFDAMRKRTQGQAGITNFNEEETAELKRLGEEIKQLQSEMPSDNGIIPEAPFEKNWHELAFKRILRYAAENGYDYVAWTTGAQQAERYDLGSVVDHVDAGISVDGHRMMDIYYRHSNNPTVFYHEEDGTITKVSGKNAEHFQNAKNISDIVGKELSIKILSQTDRGLNNIVSYQGLDLSVGGEGMKGFYDKMLPSFVSKYTKKWGAKVQDINLPSLEESAQTMHAVNVTQEMKDSVMEGQVMFSVRNTAEDLRMSQENATFAEQYRWGDTLLDEDYISEAYAQEMDAFYDALYTVENPLTEAERNKAMQAKARAIEEFLLKLNYNTPNLHVISSLENMQDELENAGVQQDVIDALIQEEEALREKNKMSWGMKLFDNVYIFAEPMQSLTEVQLTFAHEMQHIENERNKKLLADIVDVTSPQELNNILIAFGSTEYSKYLNQKEDGFIALADEVVAFMMEYGFALGKDGNLAERLKRDGLENTELINLLQQEYERRKEDTPFVLVKNQRGNKKHSNNRVGTSNDGSNLQGRPNKVARPKFGGFATGSMPQTRGELARKIVEQQQLQKLRDDAVSKLLSTTEVDVPDINLDEETFYTPRFSVTNAPTPTPDETKGEYLKRYMEWRESQVNENAVNAYKEELKKGTKFWRTFVKKIVDRNIAIEKFQDFVLKISKSLDLEGKISINTNAFLDVSMAAGRAHSANERFKTRYQTPMMDAIKAIVKSKKLDHIDIRWNGIDGKKNGKKLTASELVGIYCQAKDVQEAIEMGLPDRGQQGFKDNLLMDGDEVSHKDVIRIVEDALAGTNLKDNLWKAVNQATLFSLIYQRRHRFISRKTFDEYKSRKFYVPERGWRERDLEDRERKYVDDKGNEGRMDSPFNVALKKAKGRSSLASDPFAYIVSIAKSTIAAVEKNRVKQKFLQFLFDNGQVGLNTKAWTIKQVYLVKVKNKDGKDIGTVATYEKPSNPDDIAGKVGNDLESLKQLAQNQKNQHAVVVVKDGEEYVIWLEDEQLANALNRNYAGIKFQNSPFGRAMRGATGYYSGQLTQYNPEFAASNFVRDYILSQISNFAVQDKPFEHFARFNYNLARIMPELVTYVGAHTIGREAFLNTKKGKYMQEYFALGAQTGFSYLEDVSVLRDLIDKVVNKNDIVKYASAVPKFVFMDMLSALTELSELSIRMTQYITCREKGMSARAAAIEAKKITVDFDTKGELSSVFSGLWSFFNASVQGTNKIARDIKRKPLRASLTYAGFAGLLFYLGYLLTNLFPDDTEKEEFWNEFVRKTNFTVGEYKIPMAHFFRIFWGGGVTMALKEQGRLTETQAAGEMTRMVFDEIIPQSPFQVQNLFEYNEKTDTYDFTLEGYERGLMPSVFMPIYDVKQNEDFLGRKISKEPYIKSEEGKYKAKKYERAESTNEKYIKMADWLSGGDPKVLTKGVDDGNPIDINGTELQYIVEGYTKQFATLVDTYNLVTKAIKEEEIQTKDIPFLRKFKKDYMNESAYKQEYWTLYDYMDQYKAQRKEVGEDANPKKEAIYDDIRNRELLKDKPNDNDKHTPQEVRELMEFNKQWRELLDED